MSPEDLKRGMKVKINRDISETDRCLSSNDEMEAMSQSNQIYFIEDIFNSSRHGKIAAINSWQWMPCDIRPADEEGYRDPIYMKGKKQFFDPAEL